MRMKAFMTTRGAAKEFGICATQVSRIWRGLSRTEAPTEKKNGEQ
jgi:hypothetical protein